MSNEMIAIAIVIATLSTLIWRVFGVAIAGRLSLDHPLYEWFVHVSYAAVAAVLCLNLFVSDGRLDNNELFSRILAIGLGFWVTYRTSSRIFYGFLFAVLVYSVFVYFSLRPYDLIVSLFS